MAAQNRSRDFGLGYYRSHLPCVQFKARRYSWMRSRVVATYLLLPGCLAAIGLWRAMPVHGASAGPSVSWNRQAAARYLDDREVWWQQWPRAQKDHGTICISCHTNVPYAMVRPELRREL